MVIGAERGAGTALGIGLVAAIAVVTLALGALVPQLVARHRALAAADAAALAAADVALGAAPGVPCDRAGEIARANGATLTACRQQGVVVRVRVVIAAPLLPVAGDAQAGPPPMVPPE